jgi:hypothetical protein
MRCFVNLHDAWGKVWGLGAGKENDKIHGSFFMNVLRTDRCAANKLMNSNSKGKAKVTHNSEVLVALLHMDAQDIVRNCYQ